MACSRLIPAACHVAHSRARHLFIQPTCCAARPRTLYVQSPRRGPSTRVVCGYLLGDAARSGISSVSQAHWASSERSAHLLRRLQHVDHNDYAALASISRPVGIARFPQFPRRRAAQRRLILRCHQLGSRQLCLWELFRHAMSSMPCRQKSTSGTQGPLGTLFQPEREMGLGKLEPSARLKCAHALLG